MNELLGKLIGACERFAMINKYNQTAVQLQAKIDSLFDECARTGKKGFSAVPGVLILIFSSIFLWIFVVVISSAVTAALGNEMLSGLAMMCCVLLGLFIPALPITYKLTFCRAKNKKIKKENDQLFNEKYLPQIDQYMDVIDNLEKERDQFIADTQYVMDFLPQPYRNELAAAYMEQVVSTGRAESLKEAMNLYEEQLHRWALEDMTHRLLEQNEMRNNMLEQTLRSMADSQRRMASSLQNIDNLVWYNTWCR